MGILKGAIKASKSLHRAVSGVGNWTWLASFTSGTGVLSWVSSHVEMIARYGWPADVLAGIVFASLFMGMTGTFLAGWRYFHRKSHSADALLQGRKEAVFPSEDTLSHALRIRFESTEEYSEIRALESGLTFRDFRFKLVNDGNGFLTNCHVRIKNAVPTLAEGSITDMSAGIALVPRPVKARTLIGSA